MQKPLNNDQRRDIAARFASAVNMMAAELDRWLRTKESLSVGSSAAATPNWSATVTGGALSAC